VRTKGTRLLIFFSLYTRRLFLLISLAFENPLSITLLLYPRLFKWWRKSPSICLVVLTVEHIRFILMAWMNGILLKQCLGWQLLGESYWCLDEFFEHANSIQPSIKFTHEVSKTKISFLDTTTTVKEGNMTTDLYSKPTDKHQYLSPSSCHPKHCFKSIPFIQAIRIKRICSTVKTTKQILGDLRHHLKRREYNNKVIESGFSKANRYVDIYKRNHERGCLSDERSNRSSRSPMKILA
jgi:hypothetical protein